MIMAMMMKMVTQFWQLFSFVRREIENSENWINAVVSNADAKICTKRENNQNNSFFIQFYY